MKKQIVGLFILLSLCFIAASTKVTSYDFWWHVKTGDVIFKTADIPEADPFSFTSFGHPRIAHDWLSELLFYLIVQIGSFPAVILMKAFVVTLSFCFIIYYLKKNGISMGIISFCTIVSLLGARFRFTERPELFSLFFTVLVLFLLYEGKRSGRLWKIYSIIPATVLWVNFHGGGVLAPLFVLFFFIGESIDRIGHRYFHMFWRENKDSSIPLLHSGLVLLLVFLATFINPNGIKILNATSEANVIRSSGFAINTEWLRPGLTDFPLFYFSVALFLIVSALSIQRLDFSQFLIMFFLSIISLTYLRMIGLFFFALPFFLGVHAPRMGITEKAKKFFTSVFKSRLLPVLSVVLAIASGVFFVFHKGVQELGFSVKSGRFPIEASDFLEKNYKGEFLYNDVKFGGYLIWRFYPERKVFIDGRNELYETLLSRISKGLNDYQEWQRLLSEYTIDGALVCYWPDLKGVIYKPEREGEAPRKALRAYSAFLFQKKEWALVYWDDLTMVFLKRNALNERTIQKYEYQYLNPEDWSYILSLTREDPSIRADVLGEILRRMNERPFSQKASLLLEKFKE